MNLNKPILDATGRFVYAVGGQHAYRTHDAGDYIVSMEWVENEPAMVIWSKRASDFAHVICLSSVGKYATPEGNANPEGLTELARSLKDFGRALSSMELHRLADVVLRYVPELILMPPIPRDVFRDGLLKPMLEITTKDERGKVLAEAAI